MLISIIIPFYNGSMFLNRALTSILVQENTKLEVLIINDHSDEEEKNKLKEIVYNYSFLLDIKIIDNEGAQGPGPARQLGIDNAKGEYLMFLDVDDEFQPHQLQKYIPFIDKEYPDVLFNPMLHQGDPKSNDFVMVAYGREDPYVLGNLYNRETLIENNIRFKEDLYCCEDIYFNNLIKYTPSLKIAVSTDEEDCCYLKRRTEISITEKLYEQNKLYTEYYFNDFLAALFEPLYKGIETGFYKEIRDSIDLIPNLYLYTQALMYRARVNNRELDKDTEANIKFHLNKFIKMLNINDIYILNWIDKKIKTKNNQVEPLFQILRESVITGFGHDFVEQQTFYEFLEWLKED